MRVAVTGHLGYIGAVMVPILQDHGHDVIGVDTDLYRRSTYGSFPAACPSIEKDVRDLEAADFQGIEAVVHLAALSNDVLGDINQQVTYEINHHASVRIAELAKAAGVNRFVFASSCSMYGASQEGSTDGEIPILDESADFHPVTAYAQSKVYVERDVRKLADDGFSPTFMRNATAYGMSPRIRFDLVVNNLTAWAYTTGKVRMKSDGSPWRPLVHIEDISKAVCAVLASSRETVHNESYNIGSDTENYQIREVATIVRDIVPDCELTFADGAEPDLRNYRVTFEKYVSTFPDFPLDWTVRAGVQQIYDAYVSLGLSPDDYEGDRFKRIAQLKKLIAERKLDETMRWRS